MTAAGFAMMWIGAVFCLWFWDMEFGIDRQTDRWMASVILVACGLVTVLVGVTIWLWRVMP